MRQKLVVAATMAVGVSAFQMSSAATLSYEADALAVTTSGQGTTVQTDANTSGGKWLSLNATGTGHWIELTLTNVPAATYVVKMSYKTNNNRGRLALTFDGSPLGSALDQYGYPSTYPEATFGPATVAVTGNHKVRLSVTGKNASSSGYMLSADRITLVEVSATPTPTPTTPPGGEPTRTPTPTPTPTSIPAGWTLRWTADPAVGLSTFEGVENVQDEAHPGPDHILVTGNAFRWDAHLVDRDGDTRMRHEVKGMKVSGANLTIAQGQTWKFVYEMFMPTSLTGGSRFTHIHQMKMVSDAGSGGTPLSTLSTSISGGTETLVMRSLNPIGNFNPIPLSPLRGKWIEVELEYKFDFAANGGYARMCIRDGSTVVTDATATAVSVWANEGTCCRRARPKWGIYRSIESAGLQDTYLQIRNLRAYQKP